MDRRYSGPEDRRTLLPDGLVFPPSFVGRRGHHFPGEGRRDEDEARGTERELEALHRRRRGSEDRRVNGFIESSVYLTNHYARRLRHRGRRSGDPLREGLQELTDTLEIPLTEKYQRYCIFAGAEFYPCGGMQDYLTSTNSLATARKIVLARIGTVESRESRRFSDFADWAQIHDTQSGVLEEYIFNGESKRSNPHTDALEKEHEDALFQER